MASDEEIARQVRRRERRVRSGPRGKSTSEELEEHRWTAGEIRDELTRRIEVTEEAASEADLAAVVERLDDLEERLDDLEERL